MEYVLFDVDIIFQYFYYIWIDIMTFSSLSIMKIFYFTIER